MRRTISVSTPSRICLFGEHQDYLGLEVIASAIDLRFHVTITDRKDSIVRIVTSGEKSCKLKNTNSHFGCQETIIDLTKPIVYENKRDYLKSTINTLIKRGYIMEHGYDICLNSEIPIGKGMSSSTTMIIVLIKAFLEAINSEHKDDEIKIAELGFEAEVLEFHEPGGMMDHYASALGGLVHLKFDSDGTKVDPIENNIPGCFILFDSKQEKDTIRVLASAKYPAVEGLKKLNQYGIGSIRDFVDRPENVKFLDVLTSVEKTNILANIDNYKILKQGESLLKSEEFSPVLFGELLKKHHANLRDSLNISTPSIELILETAYKNGALGGKINGSGGGGCAFVYVMEEDSQRVLSAVQELGFNGIIIRQDTGVREDKEEMTA
jgi:galactokinase